jgi:hypothetical protein
MPDHSDSDKPSPEFSMARHAQESPYDPPAPGPSGTYYGYGGVSPASPGYSPATPEESGIYHGDGAPARIVPLCWKTPNSYSN